MSPRHTLLHRPWSRIHRILQHRRALSTTMAPLENLEKRAVAGSFIFRYPDDDPGGRPQVALFRRSGDVSTYQ